MCGVHQMKHSFTNAISTQIDLAMEDSVICHLLSSAEYPHRVYILYLYNYRLSLVYIIIDIPGAPQNIRVTNTSSSTISLRWSTPLETYGLMIFGYAINCSTESKMLENVIHYTDIRNATLFNLHPFTTYNCCVAADSNHGRGKLACQSTVTWDEGTHCAVSM